MPFLDNYDKSLNDIKLIKLFKIQIMCIENKWNKKYDIIFGKSFFKNAPKVIICKMNVFDRFWEGLKRSQIPKF